MVRPQIIFHENAGLFDVWTDDGRQLPIRLKYGELWELHQRLGSYLRSHSQPADKRPRTPDGWEMAAYGDSRIQPRNGLSLRSLYQRPWEQVRDRARRIALRAWRLRLKNHAK